jgi:hypothetical protein
MINHQDRHRIGKARLLRRQGKTYDEIRAVIGWVRDEQLARWLRAIPRPPETRRGKAQDGLRRRCRQLRSSGRTYDEIAEITGASMGSLSLWLGDMPRDFDGAKERRLARLRATCGRSREERLRQRESLVASWLTLVGVSGERCRFRVAIHETADVCRAESFWADLVRVDPTIFSKPKSSDIDRTPCATTPATTTTAVWWSMCSNPPSCIGSWRVGGEG